MLHCIAMFRLPVSVSLCGNGMSINDDGYMNGQVVNGHSLWLYNRKKILSLFKDKGEFIRLQYVHLNWFNRHGKKLTDEDHPHTEIKELDVYCEIEIKRAGSFHFYFTYEGW